MLYYRLVWGIEQSISMSFVNVMKYLNLQVTDFDLVAAKSYSLEKLYTLKNHIEQSLEQLFSQLKALNVDMNTKLVTKDGFPRNDLDVLQVRLVRVQIIRLRNDLKEAIDIIDCKLKERFQKINSGTINCNHMNTNHQVQFASLVAFAAIENVELNSPAAVAGLESGDKILKFGYVDVTNHRHLQNLAPIVKNNVGGIIETVVEKEKSNNRVLLKLSPSTNWGGRGLLGCKITEIK